jgi:hypothetical protein
VRALAVDPGSGVLYVGTENGLVTLAPGGERFDWVAGPVFGSGPGALRERRAATLVAVSSADDTVLFQLEAKSPGGGRRPPAPRVLASRGGRLHRLELAGPEGRVLGLTSGRFDGVSGCFVLGAALQTPGAGEVPALVWRCGDTTRIEPAPTVYLGGGEAPSIAIENLARHPATGELVVALRYRRGGQETSGLFAWRDGRPEVLSEAAADLGAEVTAVLADEAGGRLVAATAGAGLVELSGGELRRRGPAEEVLSVAVLDGELIAGTRAGAFRVRGEGFEPVLADVLPPAALGADLVPYDENAAGELLVGSSRQGFAVLGRDGAGRWSPRRSYASGRELPPGILWGEAVFGDGGDDGGDTVVGVGLGRGLVWLDGGPPRWLEAEEVLRGRQIWHLWRHPENGHLWVVYPPYPFRDASAGIQWLDGGREVGFVPLEERAYATLADLLHMPARGTVFSAGVAGVLELDASGGFTRRSHNRATALARDPVSGIVLGWLRERSGGLLAPTLFHWLANLAAVLALSTRSP